MSAEGLWKRRRKGLTALLAVLGVAGMIGLSFAAVPLYKMFCRVTGYGGTTQIAAAAPSEVLARTIDVHFDTNVAQGLPLVFTPREPSQRLHIGQTGLAFFEVENTSDHPVTVVATFNVAPAKTGIYFQKLQCFCFQQRVLAAHEKASLPVLYFVDPAIATDRNTEEVQELTLSYTYFSVPGT
ncbi:MAG: cytochrome c oxidase assembly protein [Hyphomonadaceae bacterium]